MTQMNSDIYLLVLSKLDPIQCSLFSMTSKSSLKMVKDVYCNIYYVANVFGISPSVMFHMIQKSDFTLQLFCNLIANNIVRQPVICNISKNSSDENINATIELFKILNSIALSDKMEYYIRNNICLYFEKLYILRHYETYINNNLIVYIYSLRVTDLFWYKSNINPFFLMENMLLLLRKEFHKMKTCNFEDWYDNKTENVITTFSYMINIMNVSNNMITKMYCVLILYDYITYVLKTKSCYDNYKFSLPFFIYRIQFLKNILNTMDENKIHFKNEILVKFDIFEELYKKRNSDSTTDLLNS